MSEEVATRDRKDHAKKEKRHKKKRTSEEDEADDDETLVKKSKSSKRRRLDDDAVEEEENKKEKKEKKKKEKKSGRKSVSFTEDTKNEEEDNSSAEDVSAEAVQTTQKTDDEPSPEESPEAKKQRKREIRAQRRQSQSPAQSDGQKATPAASYDSDDKSALSYLSQYHTDRSAWKFQKNRESQLLKKALSLDDVPAEYNQALFAYLKGLKSEGARQRLRKNAQDTIKLDEGEAVNAEEGEEAADGDDKEENKKDTAVPPPLPELSKEAYDEAIHRFKGNLNAGVKDFDDGISFQDADAEIQRRFEKRRRAELVLWTVRGKISKPSTLTSTSAAEIETTKDDKVATADKGNKNKKAPSRKKRKNRTMVVEISSSSESSDSE
ncbi:uncharacterized protein TRUGW13939_03885 [Talaromyces rugulosus]|uniref:WKF domain-containing protein n=1 Tax=Talaromyces rugulosus TaxID=121627 RepID=A0A7H8QSM1_TALRU|nr:uncharacterized protein TRUGW13939_03885 [Talaromyces rugulosus]QKX56778.1 hypothetical protein TRUGW13939_03885 [Talaromyces rugulosus]